MAERDDATRDLRGSTPEPARGTVDGTVAVAVPVPATPARDAIAETISDTGTGLGAFAATLASAPDAPDLIGKSIDRYRVLGRLGAGGMGVVYAALDPALDRKVALKVLPPLAADQGSHLEARLRREAQALARLDHPNVVRVYDVGVAEQSVFVAMQLVDGATLAERLEQQKPPAKQILAMFVAAARGLAAAHDAGIVHRDVKPSNILVDRAGRVYVGDFGLARGAGDSADDGADAVISDSNLLDEAMTREGSVLGTPLYMSPEQHQGKPATARSDQFSFCVSLWQALFGQHPFVVGRWVMASAVDAMARDAVREPPGRGVPARVVRALRRGMRHDPAARWPSMSALIDQLAPRSRARWVAVGLATAGIAGGVALSLAVGVGGAGDPCGNAGARLSTTWGAASAKLLRDGFALTRLPYADNLATQVIARLDRYGAAWSTMRVDACRATRVRGEQSDALLDRRMSCLDRRLAELGGLVQIFTHAPGGEVVDRSVGLADGLTSLDECSNTAALAEAVESPSSPSRRAEIATVDVDIARLHAGVDAGVAPHAVTAAAALVATARRIDDAPLLARALVVAGDAQYGNDQLDLAIASWREAATLAARVHDDRAATFAMREVANALEHGGKAAQALQAVDDAAIFAARGAIDPDLEAELEIVRASALDALDRFPDADAAYQRAIALEEQAHGKDSEAVAEKLVNRSNVLEDSDRYADAIGLLQRAIPILERTLSANHPELAIAHHNLGNAYMFQGKHDEARRELETALAIKRARFPAGHSTIATTLHSLGSLELDEGNLTAAERDFQEALDLRTKIDGPDHPDTLSAMYSLGALRRMQGRYDDARALLGRVLTGRIRLYGEDHTTVANVLDALANVDLATGKLDDAAGERKRALAIREKLLGPYGTDLTISQLGLAEIDLALGKCPEARDYSGRALAVFQHNGNPWWDQIEPLGISAICEDRPAQLAALRAQLEPIVAQALAGKDVDRRGDAQFALGVVVWKLGDHARGIAMIKKGAQAYRDGGQAEGAKPMDDWIAKHPR